MLTGRPRTHDAVAVGAVRLLSISDRQFRDLLNRRPNLRDRLLAEMAERLIHAADRLDSALCLSVPQRVAQFLVAGIERGGGGPSLAVRQTDIAETLGVTREAVSAALRRFREARLIDTRYRVIDVLDPDGLRRAMESGAAVRIDIAATRHHSTLNARPLSRDNATTPPRASRLMPP